MTPTLSTVLTVDVQSAVQDFYPGLSPDNVETIASKIVNNWDYSSIYDTIQEEIEQYCFFNKIDLEGKDGVEESYDDITDPYGGY